jgi:small conductance mechanosensitive channel
MPDIDMAAIQTLVATWGLKIVIAAIIFYVGRWLARILSNAVGRAVGATGTDNTLVKFVSNLSYVGMLAFVTIAALAQLGLQTASFIAVVGAAGLAIGLALQGSLSNFAAGVMLIVFKPFKTGDFIEAGGTSGVVEEIQIFSTQLRSADNKVIFVPNGAIFGGNIVNYSTRDTRRIDLVFGCGYDDDIVAVKTLLLAIVEEDERILKDPAPTVAVLELADSSVNFAVRPWVNAADYWAVFFDLNERVKLRFDATGLNIPYPQSDVHMHEVKAA